MIKLKPLLLEQQTTDGPSRDQLIKVALSIAAQNDALNKKYQKKSLPKEYKDSSGEISSLFTTPEDINKFMKWYREKVEEYGKDYYGFDMLIKLDPPLADSKEHPARTAWYSLMDANSNWITDFDSENSFYYGYETEFNLDQQIKREKDKLKPPDDTYCAELKKNGHEAAAYICRIVTGEGSLEDYGYAGVGAFIILAYHGVSNPFGGNRLKFPGLNRRNAVKIFSKLRKNRGPLNQAYSDYITANPGFMQAHYLNWRKLNDARAIDGLVDRLYTSANKQILDDIGPNISKRELRAIRRVFANKKVRDVLKNDTMRSMRNMVRDGYLGSDDFYQLVKNQPAMKNDVNELFAMTHEKFGGKTKLMDNGAIRTSVPMQPGLEQVQQMTKQEVRNGSYATWKHWSNYYTDPIANFGQSSFAKEIGATRHPEVGATVVAKGLQPFKTSISLSEFETIVKSKNLFKTQLENQTIQQLHGKINNALQQGVPVSSDLLRGLGTKQEYVNRTISKFQERGATIPSRENIEAQYDIYKLIDEIGGV